MERHYTKEQILEAYLNQINFGHGWYGIESAARHYFGKPAAKLTLAEAATLAALPKSPVGYDPSGIPTRKRERRNLSSRLMAQQGYITQARSARSAEPVVTAPDGGMSAPRRTSSTSCGSRPSAPASTSPTAAIASTRRSIRRSSAPRSRRS